jgi:hypothetical protein
MAIPHCVAPEGISALRSTPLISSIAPGHVTPNGGAANELDAMNTVSSGYSGTYAEAGAAPVSVPNNTFATSWVMLQNGFSQWDQVGNLDSPNELCARGSRPEVWVEVVQLNGGGQQDVCYPSFTLTPGAVTYYAVVAQNYSGNYYDNFIYWNSTWMYLTPGNGDLAFYMPYMTAPTETQSEMGEEYYTANTSVFPTLNSDWDMLGAILVQDFNNNPTAVTWTSSIPTSIQDDLQYHGTSPIQYFGQSQYFDWYIYPN